MQIGVILIILSVALTPLGDALSKEVGSHMPPILVVFTRYLIAGLIAAGLAVVAGVPVRVPRRVRVPLVLQSALVVGAMALLIMALSKVALALAVGGFLIAPIIAILIAWLCFGAALTPFRALGAMFSFVGALLMLNPATGVETGMLFSLSGGVLLGVFLALSGQHQLGLHPVILLMSQCLLGAAMLFPLALVQFTRFDPVFLPSFLILGALTAATHFLTVAAYQRANAAVLAPFFYFNLVFAYAIGLLWFRETPTWLASCGLGLIVLGGLLAISAHPARPLRAVPGIRPGR